LLAISLFDSNSASFICPLMQGLCAKYMVSLFILL
jgi:hypothetical protein